MERVCERSNLQAALKRVRKNKGSPGITRRTIGRSIEQVCERLRSYLLGWKQYFRLADTSRIFADLDEWIRHRLRAIHLKQWGHGTTIYRELRARGLSERRAARVAGNGRRWWRNSAKLINVALPISYFDGLGVPRRAA
jgi:RNA-directed DNA polymerase